MSSSTLNARDVAIQRADCRTCCRRAKARGMVAMFIYRHPDIFAGGLLLLIMIGIAVFAPISAPSIQPRWRRPGARAPPSAEYWFGTRHARPRRLFARASTARASRSIVGFSVALPSPPRRRHADRACLRLRALARRRRHARDGRADVDPRHPAGDRADGADAGERAERHHRHRRRRRCRRSRGWCAAWCCRCASSPMWRPRWPRGTRMPMIIFSHILPNTLAPMTVQATFICASRDHHRGRSCPSSAPARRRSSRAGATSWPRAGRSGR